MSKAAKENPGNLPVAQADLGGWLVVQTGAADVLEAVKENLGSESITARDLDRIVTPAGGGTMWSVPGLTGDENLAELLGVVIYTKNPRVYWSEKFSGGGAPPDCASDDGVFGVGDPGGKCAECPLAQFGSDPENGRGQACHQRRLIFILTQDSMIPKVVDVPPTSLAAAKKYLLRMASRGLAAYKVLTSMSLESDKNKDGVKYSKIVFNVRGMIPNPDFFKKYADTIRPHLDAAAHDIARQEYDNGDPGPEEPPDA